MLSSTFETPPTCGKGQPDDEQGPKTTHGDAAEDLEDLKSLNVGRRERDRDEGYEADQASHHGLTIPVAF